VKGYNVMIQKDFLMSCNLDIEGKIAAQLINLAACFSSDINIKNGERKANAKSLLGVLALEIKKGDRIVFDINGNDEENAAIEIEKCLC
jgi:phosphotransferase system HPr (HPr) family protein